MDSGPTHGSLPYLGQERVDDLLNLQSRLAVIQPTVEGRDAWIWHRAIFSAKAVYESLRGQLTAEDA